MKHYVFVTEIDNEQREAICRDFKFIFNVDIADQKYDAYAGIEEKWNAIMKDTFMNYSEKDKEVYVQQFIQMLSNALYGEQSDIIRPSDMEIKKRIETNLKFKQYVAEMQSLLDDYKIYEPDVWMNAYLSIQYIKARNDEPEGEDVGMAGYEDIGEAYYVKAKGIGYTIPFESSQEGFCEKYLKKILGKDQVQILGAAILEEKKYEEGDDKEGFQGYKKKVSFDLGKDKRYNRWKQDKVYSLEKSKEFKTEDRAMFHKTINGVLARNLVNTMISTRHVYDVEDYLYLLDKLCMCKSLNWQNLIGCLYIAVAHFQRELHAIDLWEDVFTMFEAWIMNILIINYRLELLVRGLVYINYKEDIFFRDVAEMEEQCQKALKEIEKNPVPFSKNAEELIKNKWKKQKEDMRVGKEVKSNHRQYHWIYVIMQRYIIDCQTPHVCDKLRDRETDWKEVVGSISSFYTIFLKKEKDLSKCQSDLETDALTFKDKETIKIGEICATLSNKEKVTKEDLLTEIRQKLIKANVEDSEIVSSAILQYIVHAFIKLKAKNKYSFFEIENEYIGTLYKDSEE